MTDLSPGDKMAAARMLVIRKAPYFTSILLSLVPRETPGLGTLGVTDSGVLLWCPEFVGTITVDQLAAVLVHEIGHVLRDHAGRRKMLLANQLQWNIAGDAEINDDLAEGGWELPSECVYPSKIGCADGATAEEYYAKLREQTEQEEGQDGKNSGDDSDDQGGETAPSGAGEAAPGQEKHEGPCRGHCGSGAGNPLPNEPTSEEEKGRSQSDLERVRNEVAEAIKQAASSSRGTIPGGWVRWADQRLKPAVIPWRQKLARIVRGAAASRAGAVDLTYRRRSRRQAGLGTGPGSPVLAAYHAPTPRIECWLDTSGSMGTDEVTRGLSEIAGVIKTVGAEIVFGSCDAQVHARGSVKRWQDLAKMVKGGGGTDFCPIFEEVQKPSRRYPRPDVLIFITDGCGPAPSKAPKGMAVIWVLVGQYKQRPTCDEGEVRWGEFVEVAE